MVSGSTVPNFAVGVATTLSRVNPRLQGGVRVQFRTTQRGCESYRVCHESVVHAPRRYNHGGWTICGGTRRLWDLTRRPRRAANTGRSHEMLGTHHFNGV
ncbi:Uncharacterised protein [Mycobacteroides abscessus subsp. massiliense]|nr:Uncharacterised protein [Mycobacteroides abscessus subsp. massiliense]SLD02000.1 Uncharacterised protein [Mycobacteroides abscessus subsp. massiliense]